MNNIDRFFTSDPAAFAAAYFNYLKSVLQRVDRVEIGRFFEALLDARKRGATRILYRQWRQDEHPCRRRHPCTRRIQGIRTGRGMFHMVLDHLVRGI